ncbi:MAG: hypothetical protein ACR2PG_08950 [Hyphomicrobiaceae bacterium]
MMTLTMALLTLGGISVWWKKSHWAWLPVIAAMALGCIIFFQDADFSSNLGVQL